MYFISEQIIRSIFTRKISNQIQFYKLLKMFKYFAINIIHLRQAYLDYSHPQLVHFGPHSLPNVTFFGICPLRLEIVDNFH